MGNEYQRFLMHHGILGQKWGKRNGPPYPLKPSQKSSAEKKAEGTEGSLLTTAATVAFVTEVVPVIATAVAKTTMYTTAALAIKRTAQEVYSYKIQKEAKEISNDKKYASERENEEIDPETGLYLTGKKMTTEENMERINPSFDSNNAAFRVNCTACTMAMELRERGYDVHAGTDGNKMVRLGGTKESDRSKKWYAGKDPYTDKKSYNATEEGIAKFKSDISKEPSTRGELCFKWTGYGHSVFYKTDKSGKLTVYDTQSGKKMNNKDLDMALYNSKKIEYTRLDLSKPNVQYLKNKNYIC